MTAVAQSPNTRTPPNWLNALMKVFLHTPGLQRLLGRSVALVSFEGRKSGQTYTTPVTYSRGGDTVVVLSKRSRDWWRNLLTKPRVELRLAGHSLRGKAHLSIGDENEFDTLLRFLEHRKTDARAYGVSLGPDGQPSENHARGLLRQIVVIRITLTNEG